MPITPEASVSSEEIKRSAYRVSGIRIACGLAAAVLCASFWLPWINLFGLKMTGYDVGLLQEFYKLVWLIPVCSLLTLISVFSPMQFRGAAQMTGALPLLGFAYCLMDSASEVTFQLLDAGAYVSIIAGLVLLIVPPFDSSR